MSDELTLELRDDVREEVVSSVSGEYLGTSAGRVRERI